jgi:hypothetical protein
MAQETGKLCGSWRYSRIYLCSSPILCAADALSMIFHFLAGIVSLEVSAPTAARLAVAERFLLSGKNSKEVSSAKSVWPRWLFFLLGTAPAAVKLASFSGVPWTKTWGMMHLVSFVTIECLTFVATINPKEWEVETIEALTLVVHIETPRSKSPTKKSPSVTAGSTSTESNTCQTHAVDLEAQNSVIIVSSASEENWPSQSLERRSVPITEENLSRNITRQSTSITSTYSGSQRNSSGGIDISPCVDRVVEASPSQFEDAIENERGESQRSVVTLPHSGSQCNSPSETDIWPRIDRLVEGKSSKFDDTAESEHGGPERFVVTPLHPNSQYNRSDKSDISRQIDRSVEGSFSQFEDATESEYGESERSVPTSESSTSSTGFIKSEIFQDFSTLEFFEKASVLWELVKRVNLCLFALAVLSHGALLSWAVVKLWYHATNSFRWSHFYYHYQSQLTYTRLILLLAVCLAFTLLFIILCVLGIRKLSSFNATSPNLPEKNIYRLAVVAYGLSVVLTLLPSENETQIVFRARSTAFSQAFSILFVAGSILVSCSQSIAWACKRWPFLSKALLVEQRMYSSEEGWKAWFFFLSFFVNVVVCVLYYCYLYDQKGTGNPGWTDIFG